jgi:RNA polymerase sigma factor (sigma-70 family)
MGDVSRILNAIDAGDLHAASELLPLVYDELRRLAAEQMKHEKPGQTLDATGLVHEAYLRLVVSPARGANAGSAASSGRKPGEPHFANRRHFFNAAAEAMRRILVENARRKRRLKRGGHLERIELHPEAIAAAEPDERLLALDEAVERFTRLDPKKAELLKLRSFAGLNLDEAAELLDISPATADRWWSYARAWLKVELSGENSADS